MVVHISGRICIFAAQQLVAVSTRCCGLVCKPQGGKPCSSCAHTSHSPSTRPLQALLGFKCCRLLIKVWKQSPNALCCCSLCTGRLCQSNVQCAGAAGCSALESDVLYNGCPEDVGLRERLALWKPLVLLIPLRLGLTEINEAYIETLKVGNLQLNSCWSNA